MPHLVTGVVFHQSLLRSGPIVCANLIRERRSYRHPQEYPTAISGQYPIRRGEPLRIWRCKKALRHLRSRNAFSGRSPAVLRLIWLAPLLDYC